MSETQHTQPVSQPSGYAVETDNAQLALALQERMRSLGFSLTTLRRDLFCPPECDRTPFAVHGETIYAEVTGPRDYLASRGAALLTTIRRGKSIDFQQALRWGWSEPQALRHLLEQDYGRWVAARAAAYYATLEGDE